MPCSASGRSHRVPFLAVATIVFPKQISGPVTLLFRSLHCPPRIKSEVLSSVFRTLHNQAIPYLSSSISLKVNDCCLLLTHPFLFPAYAAPSAWRVHNRFFSVPPVTASPHLPYRHPPRNSFPRCCSSANATFSLKSFLAPIQDSSSPNFRTH